MATNNPEGDRDQHISLTCDSAPNTFNVPFAPLIELSPVIRDCAVAAGDSFTSYTVENVTLNTLKAFIDIAFAGRFSYEHLQIEQNDTGSKLNLIISLLQLGRTLKCLSTVAVACSKNLKDLLMIDRPVITGAIINQIFVNDGKDNVCQITVAESLIREYVTYVIQASFGRGAAYRLKSELDSNIYFAASLQSIAVPILAIVQIHDGSRWFLDPFDSTSFGVSLAENIGGEPMWTFPRGH